MPKQRHIAIIIGLLLFIYAGVRAYLLSFTHDEGLTFMHFMYAPVKDIITYAYPNANNHLVNTLAMRIMSVFLPLQDHWLRLPVVLSYLLYLVFSWKILSGFSTGYWRIAAWLFLNSVPYVIEFFSLARGYGYSLGFMMPGLYFLKSFLESGRLRALAWCLAMSALAVLSNFTLLNYFLAVTAVVILNTMLSRPSRSYIVRLLEVFFAIALPLLAYTVYIGFKLKAADELFFGSRFGFWEGTIRSLITRIMYRETAGDGQLYYVHGYPYTIGSAIIIAVLALSLFFGVRQWLSNKGGIDFFQAVLIIIFLCAASMIAQFYLLGTLYVLDRTGIFFVPLFLLLVVFLGYHAWCYRVTRILAPLVIIVSIVNFFLHANLSYSLEWKYDANTEAMMKDLREFHSGKESAPVQRLYTHWTYHPAAAFYQASDDYSFLKPIERYYKVDYTYNYFYLPYNEMWRFEDRPIRVIRKYPLTESMLFENLEPDKKKTYAKGGLSFDPKDSILPNTGTAAAGDYHGAKAVKIDPHAFGPVIPVSVKGLPSDKPLVLEIEADIYCENKPMGAIAVALTTKNDSQYNWAGRQLEHIPIAPGRWTRVSYNHTLPYFQVKDDVIKIYLWNLGNAPFYLRRMEAMVVDKVN